MERFSTCLNQFQRLSPKGLGLKWTATAAWVWSIVAMTPKRVFILGFLSSSPLEPRDSAMWLSVTFRENLGRVSFVFSWCETTSHHNITLILDTIHNENI